MTQYTFYRQLIESPFDLLMAVVQLFGSQHKFDTEMGRLKNMYDDDRRKLEQRM